MPKLEASPRATPAARKLVSDNNLKLDTIIGTGPNGRIGQKDVLASLAQTSALVPAAQTATAPLHAVWLRHGIGRPIVFLHGFGADLNAWRSFLAESRLTNPVLALDLPGHGGSTRNIPASYEACAVEVEACLRFHAVNDAVLVGHSWGGAIAAILAARGTLSLKALLLIAPAGLGPRINGDFINGFLNASEPASLRPWLQELVVDPAKISDGFVTATWKLGQEPGMQAAQRQLAQRYFPDGTQAFSIREALSRLTIPCRVILGSEDRITPSGQALPLPGQIALHWLAQCAHLPHVEHSAIVQAILLQLV